MEIQGYSNYLIYEDGRVFGKKCRKYLKPYSTGKGYMSVTLCNEGKLKKMKIHRLVALHYIDNPDNHPQVDHIDRNKLNNDISNLRWVNGSMNQQNRSVQSNNKCGHKNIHYKQSRNKYVFQIKLRGKCHYKDFKTLQEALWYKFSFYLRNDLN